MNNKEKPEIIKQFISGNKIVEMEIIKTIKKYGNFGYIALPKELIGKKVKVIYDGKAKK